ncbi:breast cancer type 2 susceptibility protein isoform X2 [Brachyhypopomus gauderio]|uniref:breast cancer type 2 susceptibility protein isoform X2 n=1 Tax=Brachyhypopomus gauderio TaxID=698409 RepID=UPI004041874F
MTSCQMTSLQMNMFEDVFHRIEAELGPLNAHWFEELTSKPPKDGDKDGDEYIAEVQEPSYKEGTMFRATTDTTTLDSQMSSTPTLFRHRDPESPLSFLGDLSAPGMQSPLRVLPWSDSSPCLFGSAKDSQQIGKDCRSGMINDYFGLLDTPKSYLVQDMSAKRISESLGAQLNPDMSWSSSFNTPSTLSPTVIVSRQEDPSPVSFLRGKEVIIVRKLFPTLSNCTLSESDREPTLQPDASLMDQKSQVGAETSSTSSEHAASVWRQTVPDAIKDDDVRDTVEGVLDGAEDVLSIFFSNSNSALRRVKTKERIKKRFNGAAEETKAVSLATESPAHIVSELNVRPDLSSLDTCASVEIESPNKTKDFTQWTPLSLSDVPNSKAKQNATSELASKHPKHLAHNSDSPQHTFRDGDGQSVQSSCAVEKLNCCPDSYPERSQIRGSFLQSSPAFTFSRRPRKFVYQVQSPCSSTEVQKWNATPTRSSHTVTDSLAGNHCLETSLFDESKDGEDMVHTADIGDRLLQPGETARKEITLAALSVDHDLNMTQLCKAFSEDFTQEVKLEKLSNKGQKRNHDCLTESSSMKISEIQPKARPEDLEDGVDYKHSYEDHKGVDLTKIGSMTSGSPKSKSDSGCPTVLSLNLGREASNFISSASSESGFKTASNKSITVSFDNLEKAKEIFKEFDENTDILQVQHVKHDGGPVFDVRSGQKPQYSNHINVDGISSLTASQKADVTELCSILEEACSQNEFTQVRRPKFGFKPLDSSHFEKDWDSDMLADIDFDDSFNCNEGQVSQTRQAKTGSLSHHTPVLNGMHSKDVFIQSLSQPSSNAPEMPNVNVLRCNDMEMDKTLKVKSNAVEENKSFCFGFKTASGNDVSVSDKCLRKARNLFADLEDAEENIDRKYDDGPDTVEEKIKQSPACHTAELPPEDHTGGLYCHKQLQKLELRADAIPCNEDPDSVMKEKEINQHIDGSANLKATQRGVDQKSHLLQTNAVNFGFRTAGGKEVRVSEKALVNAKKLLSEVDNFEAPSMCEATVSTKAPLMTKAHSCSLTPVHDQSMLVHALCDSKICAESLTKVVEEKSQISTEKNCELGTCQTSQSIQSNGFKLASGKGVSVSASAIQKSKTIFKDIDNSEKCSNGIKLEDGRAKLDSEANRNHKNSVKGCKMVSDKGVSISEKAFMKAKTFFKARDLDCTDISQGNGDKSSVMDDCGFKALAGSAAHLPEIDSVNKESLSLKQQSTALNKYVQKEFTKTSAETLQSTSGCSFSTASGKMVSVSAEALQRAKAVLGDSADASPCDKRMEILEENNVPETRPAVLGRCWNFSTASGKKLAVSNKALEKAKCLLSECEVESLSLDGGLLNSAKTLAADPERTVCSGFSTASGKGVTVSGRALAESQAVFADCSDVSADMHETESHLSIQKGLWKSSHRASLRDCVPANAGRPARKVEIIQGSGLNADALKSGNAGFSTASGKSVSVSKTSLQAALQLFKDCDAQPAIGVDGQSTATSECRSSGLTEENPPASADVGPTEARGPLLTSQPAHDDPSSNPNICSVTQQKYLEQEAMECTKALLEDDLNERGLLEKTAFRKTKHNSIIEANMARKRISDGSDLRGQPPLKRRFVSEFDQISDGSSVRAPVTGSPNGALNDRRVFKYNVHLKPNITHPSSDITDRKGANPAHHTALPQSVDHRIKAPSSKVSSFVPPFQKSRRSEAPKPCVPREVAIASGVFVPPLNKDGLPGIDLLKSSAQQSSIFSSSSVLRYEDRMSSVRGKPHVLQRGTEAWIDLKLQSLTTVTCEEKVLEVWQESVELARDMQDLRIRKKKRQTVRPVPGSLYLAKTSGLTRIPLRTAVGHKNPVQHTQEELYRHGVRRTVSQISSENAEAFRFSWADFFSWEKLAQTGGVQLADGGWLIPDNRASAGKEEFYRALCDTPGVDPRLISEAWAYNHYRWVVWKRASMERAFPGVWGGLALTPEQVLLQLKLRYDMEVDHSQRSALKKIMERDDTPAKTLVLCICAIVTSVHNQEGTEKAPPPTDPRSESPAAVVCLTDGWYSIKALLDPPLCAMLQKGRLRVGGKIAIHGAELIGSQDACPPLEAPDSLMLKISANSTRPARWDAKMGFHKDPRPLSVPLSSLYSTGGLVGCVDIIVLRSYPTQWMEKKPGGVFVFRTERAEDRESTRHSAAKQKDLELLFSKIQAQFEKEEEEKKKKRRGHRTLSRREIEQLHDGEELYHVVESDPGYVEAHLSVEQVEAVNSYRRGVAERRQAELQKRVRRAVQLAGEAEGGGPNRDVTPVWKLAIADSDDQHLNRVYTLNIWRPSAELSSLLREGGRYRVYHLATSETKRRTTTTNLQFTATKKTQFQHLEVCPEWLSKHFPARRVTSFRDLQNSGFGSPCGEVDVVGYVISILDREGTSPLLYLADGEFDFISVRISCGLVQLAVEDLVRPMALLAVSNLQLRQLCAPVPCLYAGEQALFSLHPKDAHLREAIARLKTSVKGNEMFFSVAEEKLSNLITPGCPKSFRSPRTLGLQPKQNLRNVPPQQAGRLFSPYTLASTRSPAPSGSSEPRDPRSVKRKRGVDYLSRIPSPPPISPLGTVASPSVGRTFNPPRRSETPRLPQTRRAPSPSCTSLREEEEQWVKDEELAMINTQALLEGREQPRGEGVST